MTQPKKNPKHVKATVKASLVRFGKKQRAEIIKQFRPSFERQLSNHIKRESHYGNLYGNREEFSVATKKEFNDVIEEQLKIECPICERTPYSQFVRVHPHITLTESEANEALRKLGFEEHFIKEYIRRFSDIKRFVKKERIITFGIRNFITLVYELGGSLRWHFPGITITAATLILEELFSGTPYTPGDGTIKKHLARVFSKTPWLSLQNWDGDPETIISYHPEPSGKSIGHFPGLGIVYIDVGVTKTLERRKSSIRLASEEAIKRAEEGAEVAREKMEYKTRLLETTKERWEKAKSKFTR